jgi:hypothetical protein
VHSQTLPSATAAAPVALVLPAELSTVLSQHPQLVSSVLSAEQQAAGQVSLMQSPALLPATGVLLAQTVTTQPTLGQVGTPEVQQGSQQHQQAPALDPSQAAAAAASQQQPGPAATLLQQVREAAGAGAGDVRAAGEGSSGRVEHDATSTATCAAAFAAPPQVQLLPTDPAAFQPPLQCQLPQVPAAPLASKPHQEAGPAAAAVPAAAVTPADADEQHAGTYTCCLRASCWCWCANR